MSFNVSHINVIIAKPLPDTICLPMQVILNPLEKRFRYHFYGTRKTNCLDKPEWYMTQILQWIRKNDYFLTVVWRDFVSDCHKPVCNLKLEFMRGLVTLLLDKLEYDLGLSNSQTMRFNSQLEMKCSASERMNRTDDFLNNCELLTNVEYFSHLIDVVLQTDAKLTQLGYPFDEPRPSDALIHPKVFSCWLLLEQNLASDRLKDLLAKSASWSIVDETQKRVQCVDDFMALIRALNLRGHQLSDKISRSRFLQIQLNLIIEFFNHLTSLARNESSIHIGSDLQKNESNFPIKNKKTDIARLFGIHRNSLLSLNNEADMFGQSMIGQLFNSFIDGFGRRCSSYWITVLNTLKHLFDIMLEWANDQCYITFWEESVTRNLLQIGDPWLIDIGLTSARKPCNSRFAGDNNDSELHGGVFNEALSLYKQKIDEMLKETVKFTFDDLKIKSTVYINDHDHWTRPSLGGHQYLGSRNTELANLTVSTTGSILYVSLRDWLFNYSKTLHPKLFTRIWQSIAKGLDDFLYRNLILSNRFSLLGAAQLRFDLSHCLYPMFAFYSDRPEIYFSQSRDSYVLLNLLRGSAELLKETLIESLKSDTRSESNPLGPLLELGVYNLTPEEALKIIALRIV